LKIYTTTDNHKLNLKLQRYYEFDNFVAHPDYSAETDENNIAIGILSANSPTFRTDHVNRFELFSDANDHMRKG
jgi:hypothetical protein